MSEQLSYLSKSFLKILLCLVLALLMIINLNSPVNANTGLDSQKATEAKNRISGRKGHCLAIQADGTVVAWGDNGAGQCDVPADLAEVIAVSAGGTHSLALKADGTVVAWGDNTKNQATVPEGLCDVIAISAGTDHSLALKSDGTVVAWGDATVNRCNVPAAIQGNVRAIEAGDAFSIALTNEGTVYAFGYNYHGQCNVPPELQDIETANVIAISAGWYHGAALRADGTVVAWGLNGDGQTDTAGLADVVAIDAGCVHTLALTSQGELLAVGSNTYNECNFPDTFQGKAVGINAGYQYNLILRADGMLTCWGRKISNQTYIPDALNLSGSLTELSVDQSTLYPAFNSNTLDYTVNVDESINQLTLTAELQRPNKQSLLIDGNPQESGVEKTIHLSKGANLLTLEVTIPACNLTRTYTLTINRSDEATLDELVANTGTLLPAFDPQITEYTLLVDSATENIELTALPPNENTFISLKQPVYDDSLALWLDAANALANPLTSTWKDLSGKGNHGTLKNFDFDENSGWTEKYLQFDGVDDYVDCGVSTYLNMLDEITLEAVISIPSKETARLDILGRASNASYAFYSVSGQIGLWMGGVFKGWSGTGISNGNIHHLVIKKDSEGLTSLYVDGSLKGQTSTLKLTTSSAALHLGLATTYHFKGNFYQARIYNRALTDEEISQNYAASQDWLTPNGARTISTSLAPGENEVSFTVQAGDGTITKNYTVNIIRPGYLNELTLNIHNDREEGSEEGLTLSPSFDPAVFDYTLELPNSITALDLTATIDTPSERALTINGIPQESGSIKEIPLTTSENTLTLEITSPEEEPQTYQITVTRADADETNADLWQLQTDVGTLSPDFTPAQTVYSLNLENEIDNLTITAFPADAGAIVSILGRVGEKGQPHSLNIPLSANGTSSIPITILADNGTTKKSYVLQIYQIGLTLSAPNLRAGQPLTLSGTAYPETDITLKLLDAAGTTVLTETANTDHRGAYSLTFNVPKNLRGLCTVSAGYGQNVATKELVVKSPKKSNPDEYINPNNTGNQESEAVHIQLTLHDSIALFNELSHPLEAAPFLEHSSARTMVPLRFIAEALGAEVNWDPATGQITIQGNEENQENIVIIILAPDQKAVIVNGSPLTLDCAPRILPPGRTFVPLRFLAEQLGATVEWEQATGIITIRR